MASATGLPSEAAAAQRGPVLSPPRTSLAAAASSLRFRLAAAMLCVVVLVAAAAACIDRLALPRFIPASEEPVQDGFVLAVFGLLALGLIFVVIAWSLRPLALACQQAAEVGPRRPGQRLDGSLLPTEIAPLVAAVNGALDRMEAAYQTERRFTADAAHALRTPLAVLTTRLQRARLDNCLDWAAIEADLRQMTALVAQLLDLARKEQSRAAAMEPLNLARLVRESAASLLPLAQAEGRSIVVEAPDDLPILGRAADLRDMLVNVMENALRHGEGQVHAGVSREKQMAIVDIADEGAALALPQRQLVFDRFVKLDARTPGTGLGLSIVREVAEAHNGSAAFLDAPTTVLRIVLPCPV